MAYLFETDDTDNVNEMTVDYASNEDDEILKRQLAVEDFVETFENPSNQNQTSLRKVVHGHLFV